MDPRTGQPPKWCAPEASPEASPQDASPGSALREALGCGGIHVWRAGLDRSPEIVALLLNRLPVCERERALRFRFSLHQGRFVLARSILRRILSFYLDTDPWEIRLSTSRHGKPRIDPGMHRGDIRFNLSHSRDLALYIVAEGREVGIDVEYPDRGGAPEKIARRFFSPAEADRLESLPENHRISAFFSCWTRKEAFVKAMGAGLSVPLSDFTVTVRPEDPPEVLYTAWDDIGPSKWTLMDIDPGGGYAAAAAVAGTVGPVRYFSADFDF